MERRVVLASSLGTVFEWYDFYLFGALATSIAANFAGALDKTGGFLFALLAFGAGFVMRPFGALIFGRIGDRIGRKYAYLVTVVVMGAATLGIGFLPGSAAIGAAAPAALVGLRLIQGLALGGQYGGAATYVAEHAPQGKRGAYTSWIQTTATIGLLLSLLVVLACRASMPPADFEQWGWRIPFLASALLLAASVLICVRLNESPAYARMKAAGRSSRTPLIDSFLRWGNLKFVITALFGMTAGQGVIWYTGQFYALFFLTEILKVDAATANLLVALSLALGTGFFVLFGSLSDRIGRKPVIMAGCALAALTYFPIFRAITHYANPALEAAMASSPVTVIADPLTCAFQFDPLGRAQFTAPCDIAKRALANRGVPYLNEAAPAEVSAVIRIGDAVVPSFDAKAPDANEKAAAFDRALGEALRAAGYPAKADPAGIDHVMVAALLLILVVYVCMVYGPIAAALAEFFPTRIRYSSISLPYHIGNGWFGGLLPATSFAIAVSTGDLYSGLWYPIVFAATTFVVGMMFVHETRGADITADDR